MTTKKSGLLFGFLSIAIVVSGIIYALSDYKLATTQKQSPSIARAVAAAIITPTTDGFITTSVGNGTAALAGDGGPAINASLNSPRGMAVDSSGNLYIADRENHVIRKVDITTGNISKIAGTGFPFPPNLGQLAITSSLHSPSDVAIHPVTGEVYIADTKNSAIEKISFLQTTEIVVNIPQCGLNFNSPCFGYKDNVGAASAFLDGPSGIAFDPTGTFLYIADTGNHRIRRVDFSTNIITTFAGNGAPGFGGDGGQATSADLGAPLSVDVDSSGNVYIVTGGRIRKVDITTGIINTVAGGGTFLSFSNGDGGPALSVGFDVPVSIALDAANNLYIADFSYVRLVDAATGIISTFAGTGFRAFSGDGAPAKAAELNRPFGLLVDSVHGIVYIADTVNNRIRSVKLGLFCGNGLKEAGEVCDDGDASVARSCNATCTAATFCGDGILGLPNGDFVYEECDDNNQTSGDGCSSTCSIEQTCGNFLIEGSETCDDGNLIDGDGCSSACVSELSCPV